MKNRGRKGETLESGHDLFVGTTHIHLLIWILLEQGK